MNIQYIGILLARYCRYHFQYSLKSLVFLVIKCIIKRGNQLQEYRPFKVLHITDGFHLSFGL